MCATGETFHPVSPPEGRDYAQLLKAINELLELHGGSVKAARESLGLTKATLPPIAEQLEGRPVEGMGRAGLAANLIDLRRPQGLVF